MGKTEGAWESASTLVYVKKDLAEIASAKSRQVSL
jgi:hypothetical protein